MKIAQPLFIGAFLLTTAFSQAGTDDVKDLRQPLVTSVERFAKGTVDIQVLAGAQFSPITGKRDTFNYAPGIVRVGYQFTDLGEDHPLRGNWEALLDLYGAGIFAGPGNFLIGPTALIRYNFVQPGWCVVPYLQGGCGLLFNDAYEDKSQKLIGSVVEFSPQVSAGARYLINDKWSLDAEVMFHHISNANTANRNVGVNALGGQVGFSYTLGR
jgi:hypothetical protein